MGVPVLPLKICRREVVPDKRRLCVCRMPQKSGFVIFLHASSRARFQLFAVLHRRHIYAKVACSSSKTTVSSTTRMSRFASSFIRTAPALRQSLFSNNTRPSLLLQHSACNGAWKRGFTASQIAAVRNGSSLKAPRWVNSKSGEDQAPPAKTPREGDVEKEGEEGVGNPEKTDSEPSSSSTSSTSDSSSIHDTDGPSPPSSSSNVPPPPSQPGSGSGSIAKQSVPEIYPQMLALPIARRPLFPGFYKAVVVRNPAVVAAIKEMMKRGQPYLGAFLLKDENTDSDVITDVNSVHPVGVFAQITSVFAAAGRSADGGPNGEIEEGLTAVLYPHRRIKITELVKAGGVRMEEVEQQEEPQTVEPPTPPPTPPPPTEKHITESTSGISLSSHIPNHFFLIPTRRSCPNGVFAQT